MYSFFVVCQANAQWKSYIIGVKGDTLNCVDKEGKKQGKWVQRFEELRGEPGFEEEGVFVDNRKEGVWRKYNLMGDLQAIENYKWGFKDGKSAYYNIMGNVTVEESWLALNPDKVYDTIDVENVDDPGHFTRVVIKNEGTSLKHGTWRFYDPGTGFINKTEFYRFGKLESDPLTGAGSNTAKASDEAEKPKAKPKEVEQFEKENAGKKKIKVRDGQTSL